MKDSAVRVSVVIPMLNESAALESMLESWRTLEQSGAEIFIVDGGSTDGSMEMVQRAGFYVLSAPRGRARQMNTGAQAAQGDILLFLHADTRAPVNTLSLIQQALQNPERFWGRFDVQIEGRAWMLPIISFFINLRSRLSGIATGDQGIFVRRDAFLQVGGFPDQPLMEDIEISKRLLALTPPLCLKQKLRTSGRRWETRGVWRTIFLMWRLRWAYWRGVSPQDLARAYR